MKWEDAVAIAKTAMHRLHPHWQRHFRHWQRLAKTCPKATECNGHRVWLAGSPANRLRYREAVPARAVQDALRRSSAAFRCTVKSRTLVNAGLACGLQCAAVLWQQRNARLIDQISMVPYTT